MSNNKTTSTTLTSDMIDVRQQCQILGDSYMDIHKSNKDLKVAHAALQAYGRVIKAVQVQLVYKKLTGSPEKIDFLEVS